MRWEERTVSDILFLFSCLQPRERSQWRRMSEREKSDEDGNEDERGRNEREEEERRNEREEERRRTSPGLSTYGARKDRGLFYALVSPDCRNWKEEELSLRIPVDSNRRPLVAIWTMTTICLFVFPPLSFSSFLLLFLLSLESIAWLFLLSTNWADGNFFASFSWFKNEPS